MEDLNPEELAKHPELEMYINTYTYLDARRIQDETIKDIEKEIGLVRKRIRWVLFSINLPTAFKFDTLRSSCTMLYL